jgi:hypothetical protein
MGTRGDLSQRLELGLKRYNHGVRVDDDTREWGTPQNSWIEMAREELLDAIIYVIADYLRSREERGENDENELIMHYAKNNGLVESERHRLLLWNLEHMLDSTLFRTENGE